MPDSPPLNQIAFDAIAKDFAIPNGLKGRFGVIKLWPGIQVAEDEVIARLIYTAKKLGLECVPISPEGHCCKTNEKIPPDSFDFVIHLHFETPKTYDYFSFCVLWNPIQFFYNYMGGAYRRLSDNILSHDDFLSCEGTGADDHVSRHLASHPHLTTPEFTLYHSLSGPFYAPTLGRQKLFYCGINWDRLGKGKSRHQELLDCLEQAGVLNIYGPQKLLGVEVWKGYKSYQGEIPFDGTTLIDKIAECGIALALSSEAHIDSELMSCRLFESLAAGAVVICDQNPWAQQHFGDKLLYIDTRLGAEEAAKQVLSHIDWIKNNPDAAKELARNAQQHFLDHYTMDRSLATIYTNLQNRQTELAARTTPAATPRVSLYLMIEEYSNELLLQHLQSAKTQDYPNCRPIILIDSYEYEQNKQQLETLVEQSEMQVEIQPIEFYQRGQNGKIHKRNLYGKILHEVFSALPDDELACFVSKNDFLYSGHIRTLVHALETQANTNTRAATAAAAVSYSDKKIKDNIRRNQYETLHEISIFWHKDFYPLGWARHVVRKPTHFNEVASTLKWIDGHALGFIIALHDCAMSKQTTLLSLATPPYYDKQATENMGLDAEIMIDFLPEERIRHWVSHSAHPAKGSASHIDVSAITSLSANSRRAIAKSLFVSLPMPPIMQNIVFWLYRVVNRIKAD